MPSRTEARLRSWAAQPENLALADRLFPPAGPGAELPAAPWFQLAMYAGVRHWTPQQWLAAVGWRWGAWASAEGPSGDPRPIARVAYFFRGLPRDIVTSTGMPISEPHAFGAPFRPPVHELDPDDIAELAANHELGAQGSRILSVDLSASDAAIEGAFRAWLKRQRPLADRREALTAADMQAMTKACVIPYLDLRLFELASGRAMKVGDVAAALFPQGEHSLDVEPRKTLEKATRPYARKVLSPQWLDRLTAQFAPSP